MRRALLLLSFVVFLAGFISIIVLADQGRGFWTFLHDVPMGDKIGHLVLVGPLALLTNLLLRGRYAPRPFSKIMLGSFIVGSLMTLEELSQAFIPSRSFDLIDALMNLTAAALAQIITIALLRRHPSSGRPMENAGTADS